MIDIHILRIQLRKSNLLDRKHQAWAFGSLDVLYGFCVPCQKTSPSMSEGVSKDVKRRLQGCQKRSPSMSKGVSKDQQCTYICAKANLLSTKVQVPECPGVTEVFRRPYVSFSNISERPSKVRSSPSTYAKPHPLSTQSFPPPKPSS